MAGTGTQLRCAALEIFETALRGVDARRAVRRAVRLEGSRLAVRETMHDLTLRGTPVYSIALGKAAWMMARALDEILGEHLREGLIVGPRITAQEERATGSSPKRSSFEKRWHLVEGGHPLPNKASLIAARAAFSLLERANATDALLLFLISGGGSAMIEWPLDERITLNELHAANRTLISCGASIAEINTVRRCFSAIKGGGLAARAPRTAQISLIISDTARGDEASVSSGPTVSPPLHAPAALDVVKRYSLESTLPASILRSIKESAPHLYARTRSRRLREHFVLLDNESAINSAGNAARRRGFIVRLAPDITEQAVDEGSRELLSRLMKLGERSRVDEQPVCLISGGEFSCPVRGPGRGGRNSETALRWAIEIERHQHASGAVKKPDAPALFALSAGTDGIDGNSPAAGALASDRTIAMARRLGLDAQAFLERSDAYSFFAALDDAVVTGPTGTNVRDLRILLAR